MARVGIDFGTGNTVIAVYNETLGRAETLDIPSIATAMIYRLEPGAPPRTVFVIPSLIHFSKEETLIGDQILARGLAEHPDTMRWMKRDIAHRVMRRRQTAQGFKSAAEAGAEFMKLLLGQARTRLNFEEDEITFTAPTEAFETFTDWLRRIAEDMGIRRFRMLDEPTACVLGYHGAARKDEHFLVFDFGCGTLDVLAARIDFTSGAEKKATELGKAGCDLGGMDIDRWIFQDFCTRHNLSDYEKRTLEAVIQRQAEAAKIALSDPDQEEAELNVLSESDGRTRVLRTVYRVTCKACARGRPGLQDKPGESCLGCLLQANNFLTRTRAKLDEALENASVKTGLRREDIAKVLVTGGTSLVPCVGKLLSDCFGGRVEYQSPFDAVAQGACKGIVEPILQHDCYVETYDKAKKKYVYEPLFKAGTEYPTKPAEAVPKWASGANDGQTRLGLKIFEVGQVRRRSLGDSILDAGGRLKDDFAVNENFSYVCLNAANPMFLMADPPINTQRDEKRFLCTFSVGEQKRLLLTVMDNLTGKPLLKDHPVVRLS